MGLTLKQINKIVEGEHHLADINLTLASGSRNVLLGRTLAGKTSLLRILAGLDRPTTGAIHENDRDITGISVRKRSVAMVYQQFINYPSFNVYKNIASPLLVAGQDKEEVNQRVMDTAKLLHLDPMLDRMPSELSGGQQQRVAIARALVKDADLLLLDEPLVNLDYKLREELLEELQAIFEKRDSVVVYTTTEPSEALKLGGNIIVMDEGKVLQTGTTSEVYRNPATVKTAELFSDPPINMLEGEIRSGRVMIGDQLDIERSGLFSSLDEGQYLFGIRPNHLYLNRQADGDARINSTVKISEINGSETFIHFEYGGCQMVLQEVGVDTRRIDSALTCYVNPEKFFVYSSQGDLLISPNGFSA
ncbi:MAG: ABC transporter ATP-binding protein [Desulfobacteraceae bacterium]|nr:MAG: ABC transporter ATP-binding protein [Desulfobacteraceae bacterium]